MLWALWFARNRKLPEGKSQSKKILITWLVRWYPLKSPHFKVNFDAGFCCSSVESRSGVVIRNSDVLVMGSCRRCSSWDASSFLVEAKVTFHAILFAKDLGFNSIILEGDSLSIIRKVTFQRLVHLTGIFRRFLDLCMHLNERQQYCGVVLKQLKSQRPRKHQGRISAQIFPATAEGRISRKGNCIRIVSYIPKGSMHQREGRIKVNIKDLKPKRIKDYLECKISQRSPALLKYLLFNDS
ncbi:hypothetical protein GQ457_01G013470 [Hibiscus cannabinus]